MFIAEHVHSRPHAQQTTFTTQNVTFITDHILNRPHSLQTRSLQSMFIADHVHKRPRS